jgi:GAF domain-containing protein
MQYADGVGPRMHAMNTGEVVVIEDLANDDWWSAYRSNAYAHGLRSSLSLPIGTNGQIIGALNLYSTEPRTFTAEHQRRAARLADRAAGRSPSPPGWPPTSSSTNSCSRRCSPGH